MPPSDPANPYDQVRYPGHAYNYTHPDRLAVLGTLLGMRPAPVGQCRVLEIGCGDGANLLPMAYTRPGSRFFGLDLAAKPVEQGLAAAAALGLTNLQLLALDIMDFPADAGEFDYIIAHGIYSWVPADVREKVLAICQAHLAPQGIAYISYKVYPGSYISGTLHEMMRYQAARQPGLSEEKIVNTGLDLARLVVGSRPELDASRSLLKWRLDDVDVRMAAPGGFAWIYHDLGLEISDPCYFYQFMARAAQHGLQFLCEASFDLLRRAYTPETDAALAALGDDVVAREQHEDFLESREFRRSLLCRAEVTLDRAAESKHVRGLSFSAPIQSHRVLDEPGDPMAKEEFAASSTVKVTIEHPTIKAAFHRLEQIWPGSASFEELLAAGARVGSESREEAAEHLASVMLAMYRRDLITFATDVPVQAVTAGERPVASARSRQQIGDGRPILTNLRHGEMEVADPAVRQLLTLLDGTRDRAALRQELGDWLEAARAEAPGLPPRVWVDENLDQVLTGFARQHFLIA